jgi:ANTAR domain
MNTESNPTTAGAKARRSGVPMPGRGSHEDDSPAEAPGRSGSTTGKRKPADPTTAGPTTGGPTTGGPTTAAQTPGAAHTPGGHGTAGLSTAEHTTDVPEDAVARRTPTGWKIGDEELPDLTSAMVLADLLAAELPSEEQWQVPGAAPGVPDTTPGPAVTSESGPEASRRAAPRAVTQGTRARNANAPRVSPAQAGKQAAGKRRVSQHGPGEQGSGTPGAEIPGMDAEQLKETVAQLERALTVRVRVEQAIGVLAERHRLRPRQAFELLRSASRARGARVSQTAGEVVASATNPLLRIPEELARQPEAPQGRPPRRTRRNP